MVLVLYFATILFIPFHWNILSTPLIWTDRLHRVLINTLVKLWGGLTYVHLYRLMEFINFFSFHYYKRNSQCESPILNCIILISLSSNINYYPSVNGLIFLCRHHRFTNDYTFPKNAKILTSGRKQFERSLMIGIFLTDIYDMHYR